jgi:acetyl-CoA decarbonylase/synthase complex subunit gamma
MELSVNTIGTIWTWADRLGAIAVRCNVGRMRYAVEPGLYAVNGPGPDAPVFVSANYKLSFDHLRRALDGISGWILVLDTKGINVWCAAGKGTFGTAELVQRVTAVGLAQRVSHRTLIVPQLGAPGVAAHEVHKQTGFRVVYGPVRAKDIPAFLRGGMKADADMRTVRFRLADRLAVVPVELVISAKYAFVVAAAFAFLAGWRSGGLTWSTLGKEGVVAAALVLGGYVFVGTTVPSLLPWLPGRAFSIKGAFVGLLAWLVLGTLGPYTRVLDLATWLILLCVIASFMGLNFTGASTYTSLSGVKKETRIAIPVMAAGLIAALGCWVRACGIL